MRFLFALLVALVAVASAQLGAVPPMQIGSVGAAPANPGAPAAAGAPAAPGAPAQPTDGWAGRKQSSQAWGTSFDNWKKARDAFNASPKDASKKAAFDRASNQFAEASSSRRSSDKRFDAMSEKDVCQPSEADNAHNADLVQRNADDTARAANDQEWTSAYANLKSTRDAWQKDQRNANKKKAYDDASSKFFAASDKHVGSTQSWKKSSRDHQFNGQKWQQDKGVAPAGGPGAAAGPGAGAPPVPGAGAAAGSDVPVGPGAANLRASA